jgi:hypothetical protein
VRRGEQRKRKHGRSVPSCVVHVRLFRGYAVCAWLGVACVTPLGDASAFYEASRRVSDEAANVITCTTSRLSDLVVIMRSCDSNSRLKMFIGSKEVYYLGHLLHQQHDPLGCLRK